MRKNVLKTMFVLGAVVAVLVSCKQKIAEPKSILRLRSISLNGNAPSEADFKSGTAKVLYEKGRFTLKVEADIFNVKVSLENEESGSSDITDKVINKETVVVMLNKASDYSLVFRPSGGDSAVYKFKAMPASSPADKTVNLTRLTVDGSEITPAEEMTVEIKSPSERAALTAETDKPAQIVFDPPLEEGKIRTPLNEKTTVGIKIIGTGGFSADYKLIIKNTGAAASGNGIGLKFLRINGEEIYFLKNNLDINVEYGAPSLIPIEAEALNNADIKFNPPLSAGKLPLGFSNPSTAFTITVEKTGYSPVVYNVSVTRAKKKAELKSLKVNGREIQVNAEMQSVISYARDKAEITAVGKLGTQIAFTPALTDGALAIDKGTAKDVTISVSGTGMETCTYTLKLTRDNEPPAGSAVSSFETAMIAAGHNKRINFREIDKQFPSVKTSANYEASGAKEFTLKLEKRFKEDLLEVKNEKGLKIEPDNNAADPAGLNIYYNIEVTVDSLVSSKHEFQISVTQAGMEKKTFSLFLCHEGALAEAVYMEAEYGGERIIPLLNRINFIPESVDVTVNIKTADSKSSVTTKDGRAFPVKVPVNETETVLEFALTTVTGRVIYNKLIFKTAVEEERVLLDYINFYPEKITPGPNNTLARYESPLSPLFKSGITEYTLQLIPGTQKIFVDAAAIIKDSAIIVEYRGVSINPELYYENSNGKDRLEMFALSIEPNATETVRITSVSDKDSSIRKTYTVTLVSPDDDTVTDFDIKFFNEQNVEMQVIPAVGKGGLRLPPQDHTAAQVRFKITSKTEGISYEVVHSQILYDDKGTESYKPIKPIPLSEDKAGTVNGLEEGMNGIIIRSTARDGKTKKITVYEIYKFSAENKVSFEFNGIPVAPPHYQTLVQGISLPIKIKGLGLNVRFAVTPLDKELQVFKVTRLSDNEFEITEKMPHVIMLGAIMPDNAKLYYAIFVK